jgi:WhiB family transcriptional regulator, redox-sensing transcriptional regulator
MYATRNPAAWMAGGACLRTNPESFFPEGTGHGIAEQVHAARQVCNSCLVRQACLEWALSAPETDGIWGGTTPDERRTLRAGTAAGMARSVRRTA